VTDADVVLIDTSVAVALLIEDHQGHLACRAALRDYRLGLAGHAVFETLSVMSRLPGPIRRSVPEIHRALVVSFPQTHFLSAQATRQAAMTMSGLGIGGGAVYDGLVASAAMEAGRPLATRDLRALPTYQALGVALLRLTTEGAAAT
jgi:predicted nucleic acid-binding protein